MRHTLVVLPFLNVFKVIDSSIVVILAGKHNGIKVARVSIGDGVAYIISLRYSSTVSGPTVRVPSPIAYHVVSFVVHSDLAADTYTYQGRP